jgi:Ca-activated chloride channel family protein
VTRPIVCVVLVFAAASLVSGQATQTRPALTFVSPPPDTYVNGPIALRVRVEAGQPPVQEISIFADGQIVCTVQRPPYECAWDAGATLREHVLRATATFDDGTRVVANLRTRAAGYVEQVDVDAVQVTVTVTDGDGNLVRRLPQDAFRVREDGVPQAITAFSNDNIPLEIVVALDVSYSMTEAMPSLKGAAGKFLGSLRPADRVTLLAFNDNIFTLARQSTDTAQRVRAVDRLAPWGGTALYDAILTSMNVLGRQSGRRSLVVFSDGEDQSSVATLKRVEARMETSDATIYAIGLGRGVRESNLRAILDRLAEVSGGRAFLTERIDRLQENFGAIVEELSSQYLLAYGPTNGARDGGWRRIEVDVAGGKYRVRARQGYRAPTSRR